MLACVDGVANLYVVQSQQGVRLVGSLFFAPKANKAMCEEMLKAGKELLSELDQSTKMLRPLLPKQKKEKED